MKNFYSLLAAYMAFWAIVFAYQLTIAQRLARAGPHEGRDDRQPRHVEAQGVGQADEVDHLGVAIAVALPRGFRGLEEQSELH